MTTKTKLGERRLSGPGGVLPGLEMGFGGPGKGKLRPHPGQGWERVRLKAAFGELREEGNTAL